MKANELMIGDWVGIEYYATGVAIDGVIKAEKKARPCKVVSIIDDYLVTVDRLDGKVRDCLVTDLIPIPLTVDILNKNGFKYDEFPKFAVNEITEKTKVTFSYHSGSRAVFMGISESNFNLTSALVLYVYELQHLLRLVKYEKEIVL